MNKIILTGNLTKDLEVRTTSNDMEIGNNTIAVTRPFKNVDGKYESDFFNFVIFKPSEYVKSHLVKGTKILLDGELRTRTYEDKNKVKKTVTEIFTNKIEVLSSKVVNEFEGLHTKTDYKQNEVVVEDKDLPF